MLTFTVSSLNALPPSQPEHAEDRTARHLRMLAELADLAMDLARDAAAQALANGRATRSAGEAQPLAPDAAALEPASPPAEPAQAATTPHATGTALRAAACRPIDPAVLFTRLAAEVRHCVALWARLAAGARTPAQVRLADPRRAPLQDAFRLVTKNHPGRVDLLRETTARLDEELAADPGQVAEIPELLFTICDQLGIEIDLATLPDEYLGFDPDAHYEDADEEAPNPRATSPP